MNYGPEQADSDLAELKARLTAWYQQHDSTGVLMGDLSASDEYILTSQLMTKLIEGVQPAQRLKLSVGETALKAANFHKTPYDNLDMTFRKLEPGTKLELRKASIVAYGLPRQQELFVGFVVKTALSEVARTLTEGGELTLIGAARPASLPA